MKEGNMRWSSRELKILNSSLLLGAILLFSGSALFAGRNEILGEIRLWGATKVERDAGVWVDGLYMGYMKELRGSKKLLVQPGEHEITFREAGYKDVITKQVLQPGQRLDLLVQMEKDPLAQYPAVTSEVKTSIRPERAAVFVDGRYVGHASEFDGVWKGMLLNPGKHQFTISLPGFQTFQTETNLYANQVFTLKTELRPGSIKEAGAPIVEKSDEGETKPASQAAAEQKPH
jgi:hypothetical protein